MTAKSKPARVADEIEAADRGWEVHREVMRDPSGDHRIVTAVRDRETVEFRYRRKLDRHDNPVDVFEWGRAQDADGTWRDFVNVAGELRKMTAPPPVPFDPATADDSEIIAAVDGKSITWTRALDDKRRTATVNRPTVQRSVRPTLTFSDGRCFVSVHLDAIERVS